MGGYFLGVEGMGGWEESLVMEGMPMNWARFTESESRRPGCVQEL